MVEDSETEKKKTRLKNPGRKIKGERTGYESTTKKTPPEKWELRRKKGSGQNKEGQWPKKCKEKVLNEDGVGYK